jgi:hypothetical protein
VASGVFVWGKRGAPKHCRNHPKAVPFPLDDACLDAGADPEDRTMRRMIGITLLATAMALPTLAQAQSTPPVPTQTPPTGNSESRVVPPGRIQTPDGSTTDRLSKSNGTITPPDVDPGLAAKPPPTGASMPVIPPPGSGSKGTVQPR